MARSKGSKKRPLANGDHHRRPKLAQNARAAPGSFDPKKSSVKALKDWDQDDWDSEEDEFEKGQDKILLDGTQDDGDDFEAPNEVLKVHDYREARDSHDEQFAGGDVAEEGSVPRKKQRKVKIVNTLPRGRFAKPIPSDEPSIQDDSEYDDSEEETEVGLVDLDATLNHLPPSSSSSNSASDDDDNEAWRSYHVSTRKPRRGESKVQDAEAAELELAEAERLRQKARAKLVEEDFLAYGGDVALPQLPDGLEESATMEWTSSKGKEKDNSIAFDSEESAIAHLLKRKPEALALVDDFVRCLKSLRKVEAEDVLKGIQDSDEREATELGKWLEEKGKSETSLAVGWLHYHSLTTYLATLAFYFRLLLTSSSSTSLLDKVAVQLASLREDLSTLEDLGLTSQPSDSDSDNDSQQNTITLLNDAAELDEELADLLAEGDDREDESSGDESKEDEESIPPLVGVKGVAVAEAVVSVPRNPKPNGLHGTSSDTEAKARRKKEKRKRKRESKRAAGKGEAEDPNSLLALLPPRPSASQASEDFGDDYLEPTVLAQHEAAEKAGKKKSLRFYTSKITAKEKRREAATGGGKGKGYSGDEDLTYKTREERRREALKRQRHERPDGEDEVPNPDGKRKKSWTGEQDADEAGAYFDTIKELKEASRAAKKAKYDEQRLADRDTLNAEAESTGPRTAGRQILANRGLTPKRAKACRNPRVKKRLRFESAKKKVASQRAIYKSPEAQMGRSGAYAGEKSGIRDRVVKSRKL